MVIVYSGHHVEGSLQCTGFNSAPVSICNGLESNALCDCVSAAYLNEHHYRLTSANFISAAAN